MAQHAAGGETASGFKALIEEESDHILGAHLLGPRADEVINLFALAIRLRIPAREEVINLFALAIRLRIPARELQQVIFAYPTYGSDVRFML